MAAGTAAAARLPEPSPMPVPRPTAAAPTPTGTSSPTPEPGPAPPTLPSGDRQPQAAAGTAEECAPAERSKLAQGAALGVLVLGNFKGIVLDKGRLVAAGVLNARQGALNRGTVIALVKDGFRGPTTASVPVRGGLWGATNTLSNSIGTSLSALNIGAALINMQDAISDEGIEGMVTTRSGRFASLQILQELVSLSWSVRAGMFHRDAGQTFLRAFTSAEWLSQPRTKNIRMGVGLLWGGLVLANEMGMLDFLGTGGCDPAKEQAA